MQYPCAACMWYTNLAQASMCCTKGFKNGNIKAFICNLCYYENGSSNAIATACAKKDCEEMEMDVMPKLVGDHEEIEAPMRFRSAIAKLEEGERGRGLDGGIRGGDQHGGIYNLQELFTGAVIIRCRPLTK